MATCLVQMGREDCLAQLIGGALWPTSAVRYNQLWSHNKSNIQKFNSKMTVVVFFGII
jgi:hypothetical protein